MFIKSLNSACEQLLFILREINRFLEVLFEFAYSKTPCFSILDTRFSILDSRVSKLERLEFRDVRSEFRGSSRDCQLTFDRYCRLSFSRVTRVQVDLSLPGEEVSLLL